MAGMILKNGARLNNILSVLKDRLFSVNRKGYGSDMKLRGADSAAGTGGDAEGGFAL